MDMEEHDELRFAMKRFGLQDFFDERHYAHMTLRRLQAGDIVSRQDFDLDNLYFLLEGDVRFFRFSGGGKMVVLGFGHGPSMIGEVELVLHKPTVAFTELMTDCTVIEMPMDYCRRAMSGDIDFANAIAFNLAQHLDAADVNTTTNVALKLEEKIASYILSVEKDGYFELDLQLLPGIFGSTYRHLLRGVKALREAGIIAQKDDGYVILDREALRLSGRDRYTL